jgi:folate-binding protein YgfZ
MHLEKGLKTHATGPEVLIFKRACLFYRRSFPTPAYFVLVLRTGYFDPEWIAVRILSMHEQYKNKLDWKYSSEPDYRLVRVTGTDAETFLQGQMTQNVVTLPKGRAAWASSCNYQGRVAAVSLLFRTADGFGMLLPGSQAEEEVRRLSKYILRSKVAMEIAPVPVTYIEADEAVAAACPCPALPKEEMEVLEGSSVITVRLPRKGSDGVKARYLVFGEIPSDMKPPVESKGKLKNALLHLGVALIEKQETLEWLPQALNLDLIRAVVPNKGCYTGQEVINKTQSHGRIKRRMFLGKCRLENLDMNREVFVQNEPMGRIVADNGEEFLYVLSWEYADSPVTVQGQPVEKIDLPYDVTVPESVFRK